MSFEKPPEGKKEAPPEAEHDLKRLERIGTLIKTEVNERPEFSAEQKVFIQQHMIANPHHIWGDVNWKDMYLHSMKFNANGDIEIEVWCDDGYMLGPDVIKLPDHLK